jgi:hypothetical protein
LNISLLLAAVGEDIMEVAAEVLVDLEQVLDLLSQQETLILLLLGVAVMGHRLLLEVMVRLQYLTQ